MIRLQATLPERYVNGRAEELATWIGNAKMLLGEKLLILGHHYQRDEVMRWADARGDSLALSRKAAETDKAKFIVFCGVYFMAEAADILTSSDQKVILPDLNAGCSMADMADLDTVEEAWESLRRCTDIEEVTPITYINSSAALKSFVGQHGGSVCTSSNADAVLTWALKKAESEKVLFFPDQHLGRNTAYRLGYNEQNMKVWDPRKEWGGLSEAEIKEATFLLWKGHCSVHQRFTPEHVNQFRTSYPQGLVVVHPECSHEVVALADDSGSTDYIINFIDKAPAMSTIAVGTEIHLVKRLADEYRDKHVMSLDPLVCPCSTMFRIDDAHLAWILEELVDGKVHNQITVDQETAKWAKTALERMLEIV